MADAPGGIWSDRSMRAIQRDHTRLKSLVTNLNKVRPGGSPNDGFMRPLAGVTGTNASYPSYPTSGDTYVVLIDDFYFTQSPGTRTRQQRGTASKYVIARTWDGSSLDEGTEVIVDPIHATGAGWQWWIRPTAAAGSSWPLVRLYSGSWKSQYSTTSYLLNGYPADCKFTYYNGDATECGVTLTGDGSSAYNTPLLSFNASGGEYLIIPNIAGEINDSGVSYTESVNTSAASAGTAHTHTVDCPIRHFATLGAYLYKRASGATLWGAAKASSVGSTALMKGNVYNGAANGQSFSCAPMYIRDITAGDELLLRCFAYHTPSSGTVYFTYSIVELTIIRVLESDTQNTVT